MSAYYDLSSKELKILLEALDLYELEGKEKDNIKLRQWRTLKKYLQAMCKK